MDRADDVDRGLPRVDPVALAGLDALPNASVLVFDTELRYILVRGGALAQHGFSAAEFEGRLVADGLGAKRWAFYEPLYRAALSGETRMVEVRSLDQRRWYSIDVGPVRSDTGDVIGGASFATDVTERKHVQQRLIERTDELGAQKEQLIASEELFRGVFEHSPIGMVLHSSDATIVRANVAFARMLGYETPEELTGVSLSSLAHSEELARDREGFAAMLEDDMPGVSEKRFVRRDGGVVHVRMGSTVAQDALGSPIVYLSQVEDLTERRSAVASLLERERLHRAVAELGRDAVGQPYTVLIERAVAMVARALGLEFATVLELRDDGRLAFSAAVGFACDVIGTSVDAGRGSQAGYTLDAGKPVVAGDLAAETRFRPAALLTELGVVSSVTAPIIPGEHASGVIGAHTTRRRTFSQNEIYFLESVANLLGVSHQRTDVEDELARMSALLDRAQELSKVGGWQYEAATGRIDWTDEVYRIYGRDRTYDPNDLAQNIAAYDAESAPIVEAAFRRAVVDGEPYDLELGLVRAGGERIRVRTVGQPVSEDGRVVRIIGAIADITEREAVESERARLAAIVDCSQDAIIGKDRDGMITVWNSGAHRLYGYLASEAIGKPVSLLVPVERGGEDFAILGRALAGERVEAYQTERVCKDGSVVNVSLSVSALRDSAGHVIGASSIARDVTSAVRAQEQIAMQAQLLDEVDAAVTLTDSEGQIRYWSRGAQQLFGYTAAEAVGRKTSELMKVKGDTPELLAFRRNAQLGTAIAAELDARDKSGRVFPVYVRHRSVALRVGGTASRGVISVGVDISASRVAELALRRHAAGQEEIADLGRLALTGAPLAELFDCAVGAAWRVLCADSAWLIERSPDGSEPLLAAQVGWPDLMSGERLAGEWPSLSVYTAESRASVVVEDWAQERRLMRSSRRLARGVRSSVGVLVGASDEPFGVLEVQYTEPSAVPPDCLPFLYGLANVLNEAVDRRNAEEVISEQSRSLGLLTENLRGLVEEKERLIEQIPGVVIVVDLYSDGSGEFVFVSQTCNAILGVTASELLGDSARFASYVHPEDRQPLRDSVRQPAASGVDPLPFEFRFGRSDGREVWLNGISALVHAEPEFQRVQTVLFDVTTAKDAEAARERLELDLRLAQKLEAVGQLAAGVAHEINTPVQFIGNSVAFLKRASDKLLTLNSVYYDLLHSDAANRSRGAPPPRRPRRGTGRSGLPERADPASARPRARRDRACVLDRAGDARLRPPVDRASTGRCQRRDSDHADCGEERIQVRRRRRAGVGRSAARDGQLRRSQPGVPQPDRQRQPRDRSSSTRHRAARQDHGANPSPQ